MRKHLTHNALCGTLAVFIKTMVVLFCIAIGPVAAQEQGTSSAEEKVTEHAGVKPKRILNNERRWVSRYTRAPHGEDRGVDLYNRAGTQINSSILNWEYRPGYQLKEGFWTRLKYEWFPDMYFQQSRGFKQRTYEVWSELGSRWTGDWLPSNRGNYEAVQSARHAEYLGRSFDITIKLGTEAARAAEFAGYQGNITYNKHEVQRKKAEDIRNFTGNYWTDKEERQKKKAEDLSAWTGNIIDDKEERERKKAEQLSDWTGNYQTNKEEVQERKAKDISEYGGDIYTRKLVRQERSAKDARNYDGTIRISRWYLLSHDSKSKFRKIPKGKRDKKEKDLWYD